MGHIVSGAATELSYFKISSFIKDVTTEKKSIFELAVGDSIDIPIFVTVGFIHSYQLNQQHQNIDTFYRPSVVNVQWFIGSGKNPEAGRN